MKIVFRAYKVFIVVQTFQWTQSENFFLISKLLAESLRNNKSLQKRSHILQYSFAKIILNSVDNENNMLPNTAKNLSDFTNFLANMFLCGVRKNICTASFLATQKLHSWSPLKANVCIFLYICLKKFCFQDVVMFYLVEGGIGGDWINFLRRLAVWTLQNVNFSF